MKKTELEKLEKLSFEKALEKLESTVGKMEEGNLPLDQMIKYFEEGSALSEICGKKLTEFEKKIEVLLKEDEQGGKWEDFDAEDDDSAIEIAEAENEEEEPEDTDTEEESLF